MSQTSKSIATVAASEFARNFGQYRMRAQREPIAVSSHGTIAGYFIAADDYEEFRRFLQRRRTFATSDLSEQLVNGIRRTRMNERHAHLDALLDE